jgi:predicted MFS family arabinose efflux permease
VLVGWTSGSVAFSVAALLSAAAVVLLAGLSEPARPERKSSRPLRDLREGAAFVFRHELLRPIFLTQFVFNAAFFMLQAVYTPYAVQNLGLSATGVGLTLATYGAGMVVGALLSNKIARALPFGVVVAVGPIAGLVAAAVMVLTIWAPSSALASLSFFLIGVGPILWVISTTTLRQAVTPQELLGRVSAINIIATGARPIGAALGAMIGGLFGTETCLVVAAIGFLVQVLVVLISPVPRLVRQPEMAM